MFTDPKKASGGLFVIDWQENFVHWLAWREWLAEAFGKRFFPQKQTVPFAWPPETPGGTSVVSDWLKNIRAEVEADDRRDGGGPCKAIPDIVLPWRGWTDVLKNDMGHAEVRRRQEWGSSFPLAPIYPIRARQGWRYPSPIRDSFKDAAE